MSRWFAGPDVTNECGGLQKHKLPTFYPGEWAENRKAKTLRSCPQVYWYILKKKQFIKTTVWPGKTSFLWPKCVWTGQQRQLPVSNINWHFSKWIIWINIFSSVKFYQFHSISQPNQPLHAHNGSPFVNPHDVMSYREYHVRVNPSSKWSEYFVW